MFCIGVLLGSQWQKCESWLLVEQEEVADWLVKRKARFASNTTNSEVLKEQHAGQHLFPS